jgi:hypothetical protein
MRVFILTFALIVCVGLGSMATAQQKMDRVFDLFKGKGTTASSGLSDTRIAKGLKEALRVSTGHAVASTGKPDGYFANPLIKIVLPEKYHTVEKGLRLAGYGTKVDEFVLSMNRAAEQAAPHAKQIFLDAITGMTFADSQKILQGGETAATDFFKDKTSASLYDAFRPTVDNTLNQVGTVQKYNAMLAQAKKVPFVKAETLEVGDYVTNKALDGLFLKVAEEERRIRQNPAAQVTALLKDVFGR